MCAYPLAARTTAKRGVSLANSTFAVCRNKDANMAEERLPRHLPHSRAALATCASPSTLNPQTLNSQNHASVCRTNGQGRGSHQTKLNFTAKARHLPHGCPQTRGMRCSPAALGTCASPRDTALLAVRCPGGNKSTHPKTYTLNQLTRKHEHAP